MSTESVGYEGPVVHTVAKPEPVATNAQNQIGQSIKPKMKASDVLAGQKFEALEIKKTGTAETAPESPVGQMETKTTKASGFDTNPFGLRDKAGHWLTNQLQDKGGYRPLRSEETVTLSIFLSQFQKACAEYHRRSESEHSLAVLVGVGIDEKMIEMSDECRPKAHYLFFPKLGAEEQSALFITYLAGNEHGRVLSELSYQLRCWLDSNEGLEERLATVVDAGPHDDNQPDICVYPEERFTDSLLDVDSDNNNCPFSRLIVEVEWMNRGPIHLRKRGYKYFYKRPLDKEDPNYKPDTDDDASDDANNSANDDDSGLKHVRMFLGCSLFGDDAALETMEINDLKYYAALVLWKRDEEDDDKIKVHDAISFGTNPLEDDHEDKYEKHGREMLPSVDRNKWRHLENNGEAREMVIPKEGFLYKVNRVSQDDIDTSNDDDPPEDFFTDDGIKDFVVDINKLVRQFENELENYIRNKRLIAERKRSAEEMESSQSQE